MQFDANFEYPAIAVFCAVLAAICDIRSRRIPNLIVAPAFIVALLLHLSIDGVHGLWNALSAGLLGAAIFLIFYLLGGMGAGDVKLAAAVCALAGRANVPYILVLTGLCGGVMGIVVAVRHGKLRQTLRNAVGLTQHHLRHGISEHPEMNVRNSAMLRLPYGVAIASGCLLTLLLRTVGQ